MEMMVKANTIDYKTYLRTAIIPNNLGGCLDFLACEKPVQFWPGKHNWPYLDMKSWDIFKQFEPLGINLQDLKLVYAWAHLVIPGIGCRGTGNVWVCLEYNHTSRLRKGDWRKECLKIKKPHIHYWAIGRDKRR